VGVGNLLLPRSSLEYAFPVRSKAMVGLLTAVSAALVLAGPVASVGAWELNEESGGLASVGTGEGTQLPGGVGVAPGAIVPPPVDKKAQEEFAANQAREKAEQEAAADQAAERETQRVAEVAQHATAEREASEAAAKRCVVPSLEGRSLAGARELLREAHCDLGAVWSLRAHHGALIVSSQSPSADKVLTPGALVSVRLGIAHRHP
jgi:hypothetical protein